MSVEKLLRDSQRFGKQFYRQILIDHKGIIQWKYKNATLSYYK